MNTTYSLEVQELSREPTAQRARFLAASVTLGFMLDRLKRLFRRPDRATDVEYDAQRRAGAPVMPAGPPTTPYPPAAPMDDPVREEPE